MEIKTDILDELRSLSPLIAGMRKVNVFTVPESYFDSISTTVLACLQEQNGISGISQNKQSADVPEGYFDQLAGSILSKIKAGETALDETRSLSPSLYGLQNKNVFEVPAGYFEQVADSIFNKIKAGETALDETRNLSPLLFGIQHKNVFEVPVGYFDQLAGAVLNKINTGQTALDEIRNLSPMLYALQHKNVFEVPAGYFEDLDRMITDKTAATTTGEELKEISPLLYSIQGSNVYEVPDGYFTGLSDNILKKVKSPTAKVVAMRKRNFLKYAVAAVFAGALALGIYKSVDLPSGGVIEKHPVVAATLDASIEKGKNMDDQQFNEALASLNDADIAKYLENNGDVTDVAFINSNLEETKLPSQDDYLLDDATLDNYLKEIEKTTVNN